MSRLVQSDATKVPVNATRFGGDTQLVGGLQCWHRSTAGPDVVCIEGGWQTMRQQHQEAGESYGRKTRGEKSTSRNKDILEEWVCENSNLLKNVTYSRNSVKNNHIAQFSKKTRSLQNSENSPPALMTVEKELGTAAITGDSGCQHCWVIFTSMSCQQYHYWIIRAD